MAGRLPQEGVPGIAPKDTPPPPMDNPLATMLFPQGQGAFPQVSSAGTEGKEPVAVAPAPLARLQKLMPFVHLLSMWALLAYFVVYMEPRLWTQSLGGFVDVGGQKFGMWRRWAELGRATKLEDVALMLRVQVLVSRAINEVSFRVIDCERGNSPFSGHLRRCSLSCILYGFFPAL